MIAILDYGSGNIRAIKNIYDRLNLKVAVAKTVYDLSCASKLILPGVGAFDDSISRLNDTGLRGALDNMVIKEKVPILGVCVGMQMMACSSEEGKEEGLGWFENSKVVKIDESSLAHKPKLPHMGWNSIGASKEHQILEGIDEVKGFYFLHSYVFCCEPEHQLTTTTYGQPFTSAIHKANIFGFQFHPEKSHSNGIRVFKNFAELA